MKILKRIAKILAILLLLLIVVVSAAVWYLFTPEYLTPIVKEQANSILACNAEIKKVEPTLFGSYPFFGIEIQELSLTQKIDSNENSKIDTLVYAKTVLASVDISSVIFENTIILDPFLLENGYINAKVDADKQLNLASIVKTSNDPKKESQKEETTKESALPKVKLNNIEIRNFKANFTDLASKAVAEIKGLDFKINLDYNQPSVETEIDIQLEKLLYATQDSAKMSAEVNQLALKIEVDGNHEAKMNILTDFNIKGLSYSSAQNQMEAILENFNFELETEASLEKIYSANLKLDLPVKSFSMNGNRMVKDFNFHTLLPFSFDIKKQQAEFNKAQIKFNQQTLSIDGEVKINKDQSIDTDVKLATNSWNIENLIALIPKAYAKALEGIKVKGISKVDAHVKGKYSKTSFPIAKVNFSYQNGYAKYKEFPSLKSFGTELFAKVDMNKKGISNLKLKSLNAKVMNNSLNLKATINNFMNDNRIIDATVAGDFLISDFKEYIPKEQKLEVTGRIQPNFRIMLNQSDVIAKKYHNIFASGDIKLKDLFVNLKDSLKVKMANSVVKVNLPSHSFADRNNYLGTVSFSTPKLSVNQIPNTKLITEGFSVDIAANDLLEGEMAPITKIKIGLEKLSAKLDTIDAFTYATNADINFNPIKKDTFTIFDVKTTFKNEGLVLAIKDTVRFDLKSFYSNSHVEYDKTKKNIVLQLNPSLEMDIKDASFNLSKKLNGQIPSISYQLRPDSLKVKSANILLGNSDFNLSGTLSNISKFLKKEAILKGDFNFISDKTDIPELLDIVNGMGAPKDTTQVAQKEENSDKKVAKPFMVPQGIDLKLYTHISKTKLQGYEIDDIKGGLSIKDGAVVLEQMGFTSGAAEMQLTGIYRSKRENHLYTLVDFHLLKVDIEELIKIVPDVDSILPMLKSFKGKGEFHLAGESYLFRDYKPKTSTIRGAAAFAGQDLELMDNPTLSKISSMLSFDNKEKTKIDSLSVEVSLFKDELDMFPFLLSIDDYAVVIQGRHNFDNSLDYNIAITKTPLPVRMGVNVKGTLENMEYNLFESKYSDVFEPEDQGLMEKQVLKMKKQINKALRKTVK